MQEKILLIDDDPALLQLLAMELEEEGYVTESAQSGSQALSRLHQEPVSVVLLDLGLPDAAGQDVLKNIKANHPKCEVIILTACEELSEAVTCMQLGAADFLTKPFDRVRLITSIRHVFERIALSAKVDHLTRELRAGEGFASMIGQSPTLQGAIALLNRASASDISVLIEGESGTGKEVAARALHSESNRRSSPFIAVNCGAIPESLIESELFGHEKGAFTGATRDRQGCFEEAQGGTIFLDEIGELRPDLQVRLLRVLQERCITRVGSNRPIPIDVRVVAATNRSLKSMIDDGSFREDLFYRVSVFPVLLPPLRERPEDIPLLAQYFLKETATQYGKAVTQLSRKSLQALMEHPWPGNVRELKNVLERAVIMEDTDMVRLSALPDTLVEAAFPDPEDRNEAGPPPPPLPAAEDSPADPVIAAAPQVQLYESSQPVIPFEEHERRILDHALRANNWNVGETARQLKIGRATVYRKIERFGLSQNEDRKVS